LRLRRNLLRLLLRLRRNLLRLLLRLRRNLLRLLLRLRRNLLRLLLLLLSPCPLLLPRPRRLWSRCRSAKALHLWMHFLIRPRRCPMRREALPRLCRHPNGSSRPRPLSIRRMGSSSRTTSHSLIRPTPCHRRFKPRRPSSMDRPGDSLIDSEGDPIAGP
jgi:hypothetical protein